MAVCTSRAIGACCSRQYLSAASAPISAFATIGKIPTLVGNISWFSTLRGSFNTARSFTRYKPTSVRSLRSMRIGEVPRTSVAKGRCSVVSAEAWNLRLWLKLATFPATTLSEKTVILNSIQKMKRSNKIRRIYMSFKKIIIESYFLTEVGSTQVLKYNGPSVVLGEYKGCVPFSEIGKTWAI